MVLERIEDLLNIKQGYLVIFFLIVIDLVSKSFAEENLVFGQAIPLIPILDLLLVFNSGIAFSIFDYNNNVFSFGISLFGLIIVAYLHSLYKNEESSINRFALILIISGAIGNILDRLPDGVVTDFLFFHVIVLITNHCTRFVRKARSALQTHIMAHRKGYRARF